MILYLWRLLALTALAFGALGVMLPGLPTTPFLILAAWAGGRGWPAVETWLLNHPKHGPVIQRWRERRVVPRQAKYFASAMMVFSAVVLVYTPVPLWLRAGVIAFMSIVALWLWSRPDE